MDQSSSDSSPIQHKAKISIPLILFIVFGILAVSGWYGMHEWESKQNLAKIPQVETALASQGDLPIVIKAVGTIASTNTVVVRPLIDGVIKEIDFKEGTLVHKGQVLARMDDRMFQAAVLQAQGQYLKDQAILNNAKLDLQRYKQLWEQDSIAKQQYDTQGFLVKQYEGVLKTDQAALENAQIQLGYANIIAPVSGRIGLRQVDVGNMIHSADSNGIANITQMDNITAVFPVPQQFLGHLVKFIEQTGKSAIFIEAWNRQNSQKLADGKLLALDNQVNSSTHTINVKAQFERNTNRLFPNQMVNIKMDLGMLPQVLSVPNTAVKSAKEGSVVYKVATDQTIKVVPVIPGLTLDDNTIILSGGLKKNDVVVKKDLDQLKEGMQIRLADKK